MSVLINDEALSVKTGNTLLDFYELATSSTFSALTMLRNLAVTRHVPNNNKNDIKPLSMIKVMTKNRRKRCYIVGELQFCYYSEHNMSVKLIFKDFIYLRWFSLGMISDLSKTLHVNDL